MDFYKRALELKDETVADRRYIHENAEAGLELPKTKAYVMDKLKEYGLDPVECGEGVTAMLGNGGKVLLLRADMDGLPMPEKSGEAFACPTGKTAHTCGHDFHAAMLLSAARRGEFQRLYVKDISRLFRNTLDFITVSRELANLGVQLHLVNMGEGKDIDMFTLNLMAMIAENESQKISERTKFGKQFSKERGIVPNFVFGYDRTDKYTLVPNPEESRWVQKIFDLYTEEEWGMAKIAKFLYESHVKTKKLKDGQPNYNWSQISVGRILTNPIYIGMVINGKESMKDIFTSQRQKNPKEEWYVSERPEFRIISDEQFEKAQQIKEKNAKQYCQREKRSNKHLFSNLIKCNSCGFSYRRYQKQYSPNRPPKVWWTCSKRSSYGSGRCDSEYIRIDEDWLKSALNTLFKSLLDDRESFFTLVETRCNSIIKEYIRNTSGIVLEEVENRLDELKQERERLKTLAVKALITMDEAEHDMIPINEEIEKLSFRLNETNKTREITQKIKASIQAFLNTFSAFDFSGNITNEELKKVVKEIRVVSKNEIYVYFNIAEDIEGLNFPINISDVVEIDTDSNNRAQRCT